VTLASRRGQTNIERRGNHRKTACLWHPEVLVFPALLGFWVQRDCFFRLILYFFLDSFVDWPLNGTRPLRRISSGFLEATPTGDSKNPTLSTVATEINARDVVRCRHCLMVQFRTLSDFCRRCAQPLPSPPRLDAPVNGELHGLRSALAGSVPFSADRGLSGDGLRLRGKTARELTIGRKLRELREQKHLTQQEMAVRAGVPRTYISRIENARLLPGPLMLHRIADALSVAMLDLLPHNQNGNGHLDGVEDSYWAELAHHLSHLRSEQILLVLAHARSLVGEDKSQGLEAQLVAS